MKTRRSTGCIILCAFLLMHFTSLLAQPKILVVIPDKFGANTNLNLDNLQEYGYEIVTAGVEKTVSPCPWSSGLGNSPFKVDTLIQELEDATDFDAIIIMPMNWSSSSNPYGDLINSQNMTALLQEARGANKVIWATCAGVRVLAKANILDGVKVSGRSDYAEEYREAGAEYVGPDILPVTDQNIITSTRGMYYMQENIEAVAAALQKTGLDFSRQIEGDQLTDDKSQDLDISIWEHHYSNAFNVSVKDFCNLSDGSIVAVGYTWNTNGNNCDLLLIKTDLKGNMQWQRQFGGSGWELGLSVIETSDGQIAACGISSSNQNHNQNAYLIKCSPYGDLIWEKQLGGSELETARDLAEDPMGNLILAGYTESYGAGENDAYIASLNPRGETNWIKTYGGTGPEIARSIIVNSQGNYVFAGETGTTDNGNRDFWVVEINPEGETIWEQPYHKYNYDSGYQIIDNRSDGYYVIGHSDIHGQDFLEMSVLNIDYAGTKRWFRLYEAYTNFYDYGKSIAVSPNGTLAYCGVAKNKTERKNTLFIRMFDPDGRSLMNNYFNLDGSRWCTAIKACSDNNFIIAGQIVSGLKTSAWLLKIQNPLVSGVALNQLNNQAIKVWPNPFSDELSISLPELQSQIATYSIIASNGQVIKAGEIVQKPSECCNFTLNLASETSAGNWYLVEVQANGTRYYQKALRVQ